MIYIFYFLTFFFGAVMASFFNVLANRLPQGKKIGLVCPVRGKIFNEARSACPKCGHQLAWPDLIPLFSFLFLGGKCRWCRQKISWQYLFSEVVLGGVFVLIAWQSGLADFFVLGGPAAAPLVGGVFLWLVSGALLAIFIADLKYLLIPDETLWLILILTLLYRAAGWLFGFFDIKSSWIFLLSSLVLGGIFLLVYLISRGKWIGFGDVKLFFVAGFLLGPANGFLMIFLASLAGSLVGIGQIIFKGKNLKSEIPFGVFLAPAILAALLFGERIIGIYINFISF